MVDSTHSSFFVGEDVFGLIGFNLFHWVPYRRQIPWPRQEMYNICTQETYKSKGKIECKLG
jgi:hypothetical protein